MGVPLWREPTTDSSSQSAADKDPTAEARSTIRRRRPAIREANRAARNARLARYATAFERSVDAQYETHDLRTRRGFGEPGHILRIPVEHADDLGESHLFRDVGGVRYEYLGEVDGLVEYVARRAPSFTNFLPAERLPSRDPDVPSIAHLIRRRTRFPTTRNRHTQDRDASASPDSSFANATLFEPGRRENRSATFVQVPPIVPQAPTPPPPPPPPQRLSNPSTPRPRSRHGRLQTSTTQPAPSYHELSRERRDSRNLRERASRLRRQTQELHRASRSLRQRFGDDASTPADTAADIDGLGDRQRSLSPESENDQWATLLTTIPPDPSLPSASSSFASSAASFSNAVASRPSTNPTSFSTPDEPDTLTNRTPATTANNPEAPQVPQDSQDAQDCDADGLFQPLAPAYRAVRHIYTTPPRSGAGSGPNFDDAILTFANTGEEASARSSSESLEAQAERIRRSIQRVQRCNQQLMLALQAGQLTGAEALPALRSIHDAMENIQASAARLCEFSPSSVNFDEYFSLLERHEELMRAAETEAEAEAELQAESRGADEQVP